ncbi:hypothetical protein V6N13_141369 [Hibiscus sabdariffa]
MQVNAILDLVRTALPTRNRRNTICTLYVDKQLRFHRRIICRCWVGIDLEHLFGIFRQPSFGHRYSTLLHFHPRYTPVLDTKGSYRDSIITGLEMIQMDNSS